jgi:hypothetical protein
MSALYNTWYEQAVIPCPASHEHADAEAGIGQVNVDGKVIKGGIKLGGVCHFGGVSTPTGGYVTGVKGGGGGIPSDGGHSMFYMGGGVARSGNGYVTANTTHAIRRARSNHL